MPLVVLTGGARSGKSAVAQELARRRALEGEGVVVAVFGDATEDAEMAARIERHRLDRPDSFRVLEAPDSLGWLELVEPAELLVVDCLGTLVARAMAEMISATESVEPESGDGTLPGELAEGLSRRVDAIVDALLERSGDTIVVTNEVGAGVVPAFASGRLFRDVLGRANRRLVQQADVSYLVVCGKVIDLGALPSLPVWPAD